MPSTLDDLVVFSRRAVRQAVAKAAEKARNAKASPPLLLLDCTVGNGVDAEFLAGLAAAMKTPVRVLAFDIQEEALQKTRARLEKAGLTGHADLISADHARLSSHLAPGRQCAAAMYNLGFLPGSQSRMATTAASSVASLKDLAGFMLPGGLVSIHCYAGHSGGSEELGAVTDWALSLPWREWRVLRYEFSNKANNPETLFLALRMT